MGFSRQEYWSGLPFPSPVDHILSNLSTMTCPSWVAPRAWLSFIELDKAVVLVWLDWLVFCEYGLSVFSLWCPLATPTVLLGFLLSWVWGISSWLLQQSTAIAPYLGQGVSYNDYGTLNIIWRNSPSSTPSFTDMRKQTFQSLRWRPEFNSKHSWLKGAREGIHISLSSLPQLSSMGYWHWRQFGKIVWFLKKSMAREIWKTPYT